MEDLPAMSRANDRGYGESRQGRITLLELTYDDIGDGDRTCAACLEKTDGDVIFMVYICTYYIISERLLVNDARLLVKIEIQCVSSVIRV